ncbi:MAG: glycosyltransferase family 2 protein [Lachnospiraceae bacterium]|nr:glycosyltransferase family 2 protein [Lachnospiraceae bacterium]
MYFTICIPAYNRGYVITRALDSIRTQRFASYEVLIIDDGSTDNTKDIVYGYINEYELSDKFFYCYKPNGGKHSALNIGIEKAKGEFFLILDSDDWLTEEALEKMHNLCQTIEDDDSFCGIMGRMQELDSGKIEGSLFDMSNPISSYFDFHFTMKKEGKRFNCCEANKTALLKQYRFPEQEGMKFVPEAWLFDQIGVKYKLLLTNDVYRYSEYLPDGMNADKSFKVKHNIGFLYHYISRLENVLPNAKMDTKTKIKLESIAWLQYWNCVSIDNESKGPRVKKISALGHFAHLGFPYVNLILRKKFDR